MENKLINFKEWDGVMIHRRLLRDQVELLEFQIVKEKCKMTQEWLRIKLKDVRNELKAYNELEFNI